MSQVTQQELHDPATSPSTLNIAPGVELNDLQRRHTAIVLDIFQAKGTRGKMWDNFTEDAVYEDPFASCKDREEAAGQLLNLPTVLESAVIHSYQITSNKPVITESGSRLNISANEIIIHSKHEFTFKVPLLPKGAKTIQDETDLLVYSTPEGIVRLQDRPMEKIPENSLVKALRTFNATIVPKVTSLPENEKEDAEKYLKEQK